MSEAMIKSLESYIENFEGSKTQENETFTEGIIYGLSIAQAMIVGAMQHQEKDNGNTEKQKE